MSKVCYIRAGGSSSNMVTPKMYQLDLNQSAKHFIGMRSMPLLGGSFGIPPRKCLKNRSSDTESDYNFIYSQDWSDCVISIIIILYSSIVKLNSCSSLQL